MRISRAGIIVILALATLFGANCSIYNKVMARKNLVDGAKAFKDRKFDVAEQLFRDSLSRAPEDSAEHKTSLLFLARTLHSEYAANKNLKEKAEQAIEEYQKVLKENPADNSSFKAVANLYENLNKMDDWKKWLIDRTNNPDAPAIQKVEAYTSLAAKQNTCANDITDVPAVKKTVTKDGKAVFVFSKTEKPEDMVTLRGCVDQGMDYITKALSLEDDKVKNAKNVNVSTLSDKDLADFADMVSTFESTRSYNTSLLIQAMRLAEMEGKNGERDSFKQKADQAKQGFQELADIDKKAKDEIDARAKAKEEESNTSKK